jgi:hypothetical protein
VELSSRQFPGNPIVHSIQGLLAALRGDARRARQQIERTVQNKKLFGHYHHSQHDVAAIYALLGEPGLAVEWLADAAHNGFPCHAFFEKDPLLESLRGEERFHALMIELRGECDGYRKLYEELRRSSSGAASAA